MMYNIVFQNEKIIKKDIFKIPELMREKIFSSIENLGANGILNSKTKKLKNYKLADYRLRVWDYRILFNLDVDREMVVIFRILHRSKLY